MNKQLGVLLYDHVQPMDVIGPWEVFSFWKNALQGSLDMSLIAERAGEVQCDNHITLKAEYDFKTAPTLDYLVVPGGVGRRTAVNNQALIAFIKKQADQGAFILSVCTGMFLVYQAGLLDGKKVTTYWRAFPELQAFQNVQIVEERIVKNEGLWLSGGVTSGIDLSLAFIADIAGKETAGKVQLLLEYFPQQINYATPEMVSTLPAYAHHVASADLPAYVKTVIGNEVL